MKQLLLLALLLALSAGAAHAIEPDPRAADQFGNPEEPAMRPYKWIFHGFKGLVYHPGKSFVDGNMNLPILGTVEVTRGARRGVIRFGESAVSGILYRQLPKKDEYKDLGRLNSNMEDDKHDKFIIDGLTNIPVSIAIGVPLFPVQVLVDHYPMEDDETVRLRQEEARVIRQHRKFVRERDVTLSDLERAQRSYVGGRATSGKQSFNGGGNLLKRFD